MVLLIGSKTSEDMAASTNSKTLNGQTINQKTILLKNSYLLDAKKTKSMHLVLLSSFLHEGNMYMLEMEMQVCFKQGYGTPGFYASMLHNGCEARHFIL